MAINVSLAQLLSSPTITRVISRLKTPQTRLQTFFGMQMGGPATNPVGGHVHAYDIFDKKRSLATGRAPGSGPANVAANPVGNIQVTLYRSHEKISLLDEKIFRTRPLGSNWGTVDARGMNYITKQEEFLAQRFKNMREFMCAMAWRGGFDLSMSGENLIPVALGGGQVSIRYFGPSNEHNPHVTAGTLGDVVLTDSNGATITGGSTWGDTSWSAAAAPIMSDIMLLNACFEANHGRPLRHVWLNSATMTAIMTRNTELKAVAGTANTVFNEQRPSGIRNEDGIEDTGLEVVLKAIPWLTWHVYDGGLDVNGTYTQFFPNFYCAFAADPSSDWAEWTEGSEIVRENVTDQGSERYGFAAWSTPVIDPAGFELKAVDNGIPCFYVPRCLAYGRMMTTLAD